MRKLKRNWSEATADGKKWFESTVAQSNPLKHFKGGDYMVFGSQSDSVDRGGNIVDGVAIVKGAPVFNTLDRNPVQQRLMLGAEGAKELDAYLESGAKASEAFDYLKFTAVFDLRRLNLSVEEFCQQLEAQAPVMYIGFPRIYGDDLQPRIIQWLRQPDISLHILEEERGLNVRSVFFSAVRVVEQRMLRSCVAQLKREPHVFVNRAEASLKAAMEASPADEKELHKAIFAASAALAGAPDAPQKRIRDLLIKAFEMWRVGLSLGDEKIRAALQFVCYLFEYFELFQQEVFEDEDVLQWLELKRIID